MWSGRDADIPGTRLQILGLTAAWRRACNAVHRHRTSSKEVEMKGSHAGAHVMEAEYLPNNRAASSELEQGPAQFVKWRRVERKLVAVSPREGVAS